MTTVLASGLTDFLRSAVEPRVRVDAIGIGAIYALMAVGIGLVFGCFASSTSPTGSSSWPAPSRSPSRPTATGPSGSGSFSASPS